MHRLLVAGSSFCTTSSAALRAMSSSIAIADEIHIPSLTTQRSIFEIGVDPSTTRRYLKAEAVEMKDGSRIPPRNVKAAHFTLVLPEPVPKPYPVAYSTACADALAIAEISLNLQPTVGELQNTQTADPAAALLQVLAGNRQLPGLQHPLCTVYGCHSYGHWFGQLGDGRAITIGEVVAKHPSDSLHNRDVLFTHTLQQLQQQAVHRLQPGTATDTLDTTSLHFRELQLKGSGRSPYSRGFDGRAVLRSSVREYLASEAMHHLAVPTTRALSLVTTGQAIRRAWYAATSEDNPYVDPSEPSTAATTRPFPPDVLVAEPGSIVCRVSRSFLRFGHLELFAKRQEWKELVQLLDFACLREYPHLLLMTKQAEASAASIKLPREIPSGGIDRYVELYRNIAHNTAYLVSQWIRVGYIQGNMNSDNTLISGTTLDYGPFTFLEKFEPFYTPFTSDSRGRGGFLRQGDVMALNVSVLGEVVFEPLIRHLAADPSCPEMQEKVKEIRRIAEDEFSTYFGMYFRDVQVRKLGLLTPASKDKGEAEESVAEVLWRDVLSLMHRSECDYTIFFRELSSVTKDVNIDDEADIDKLLRGTLSAAFYRPVTELDAAVVAEWTTWIKSYIQALKTQNQPNEIRRATMNSANPKYILRSWMSMLAYEKAETGDYSIIKELEDLLCHPYSDAEDGQLGSCGTALEKKYYSKTPEWARTLPGVTFMS